MGFFKALIEQNFLNDSQGNILFYPWGWLGSGFTIDSEEKKIHIQNFIKKFYLIGLLIFINFLFLKVWVVLILMFCHSAWYYFVIKKQTQNLQKTTEKFRLLEFLENTTKFLNLPALILFEVLYCGLIGVGISIATKGKDLITAYSTIIFFALGAILFGYMIKVKLKKN